MINLHKINLGGNAADRVSSTVFSNDGHYLASVVGPRRQLELTKISQTSGSPGKCLRPCKAPKASGITAVCIRNFIAEDLTHCSEVLYCGESSNLVYRFCWQKKKLEPIPSQIEQGELYCIRASRDGRYLALGSTEGLVEVWNLDGKPVLILRIWLVETGNIVDMSFSASNCLLYVSGSQGRTLQLNVFHQSGVRLDSENNWNCFAIACQPEGQGVAFAGDGNKVWLLNVGNTPAVALTDDVPFPFTTGKTVTGGHYSYLPGLHQARLGCIETLAGDLIRHLSFLDQNTLSVVGATGVEVFDLPEKKRLLRQPHSKDKRVLALGCAGRNVLVVEC